MIEWHNLDSFRKALEIPLLSPRKPLEEFLVSNSSLDHEDYYPCKSGISHEEFGEPGPFKRWYGISDDVPFFVTSYIPSGKNIVSISIAGEALNKYQYMWGFLEQLTELPKSLLQNVVWINGHKEDASISVFFNNPDEIVCELFRAVDYNEAKSLIRFLQKIGSNFHYFTAKPENLNLDWIIIRKVEGSNEQTVGRYPSRASAEFSAKIMSEDDESFYLVFPEVDGASVYSKYFKGSLFK